MRTQSTTGMLLLALAVALGCSEPAAERPTAAAPHPAKAATAPALSDFRQRLASAARPAADRARDAGRRPADVVAFLDIGNGDHVIDLVAAGGYYTEVLSMAVGKDGRVVAQNPDTVLRFRDGANEKALSERLAGNRLPNVTRLNKNFEDIGETDGAFDAAITALNFHDIYNSSGPQAAVSVLETVYSVLKPGGVLGILDHAGIAGADNRALHRVEKTHAIEAAETAGFVLEGDSDLLANPDDDRSRGVFSEGLRGRTDRFLLKFRKPAP